MQWDKETFEYWLSIVAEEEASKRDGLEVGKSGLKVCVHYNLGMGHYANCCSSTLHSITGKS
jgi:hypothetical protein